MICMFFKQSVLLKSWVLFTLNINDEILKTTRWHKINMNIVGSYEINKINNVIFKFVLMMTTKIADEIDNIFTLYNF